MRPRLVSTFAMSYSRRTLAEDTGTMFSFDKTEETEFVLRDVFFFFLFHFLTFVLAVTGRVLALLNEDLRCCVQGDGLDFGHQEQRDKLLAHDAQRFVFPVATSYK